jgi:hypothetical protein
MSSKYLVYLIVSHNTQETTWEHPTLSDEELEELRLETERTFTGERLLSPVSPNSAKISCEFDSDLPDGWEAALTPEGIPYFINHITKQTTWVDPRTRRPSVASTQTVYLLNQLRKNSTWSRRSSWAVSGEAEPENDMLHVRSHSHTRSYSDTVTSPRKLTDERRPPRKSNSSIRSTLQLPSSEIDFESTSSKYHSREFDHSRVHSRQSSMNQQ